MYTNVKFSYIPLGVDHWQRVGVSCTFGWVEEIAGCSLGGHVENVEVGDGQRAEDVRRNYKSWDLGHIQNSKRKLGVLHTKGKGTKQAHERLV